MKSMLLQKRSEKLNNWINKKKKYLSIGVFKSPRTNIVKYLYNKSNLWLKLPEIASKLNRVQYSIK